jgi:SAM-dependent methyltransferase
MSIYDEILWPIQQDIQREDERTYFGSSIMRYHHLIDFFQGRKGRILDLGCSPGHNTMILAKMGIKVVGIDLNKHYLAKYNPSWFHLFDLIFCNVERSDLPFRNDSFDYVLFTEVLEHIAIKKPSVIISEIYRVLRPGGVLYLTTPNVAHWTNIVALLLNKNIFWNPSNFYGSLDRHNREYTSPEVVDALTDGGFKDIQLDFYNAHSNWNSEMPKSIHPLMNFQTQKLGKIKAPIFNNTIIAVARK